MDANALLQCFACTLNHDSNVRKNAELHLKQASTTPGFLGACMDIIGSSEIPENVKLSACLYFKNKTVNGWTGQKVSRNELLSYEVDNDEKPVIKDMLIQTMLICSKESPRCMRVLKSALTVIIGEEYPHRRWDDLLPAALKLLNKDDIDSAYVGLLALSEIFRTFRWKENDSRQNLEVLILECFPGLLQYANEHLIQDGNTENAKVGEMVKLILKIYKFVTYHDLPFVLQREDMFISWANFFVTIIQLPLSNNVLGNEDEERKNNDSWVKCKKWSYAIVYRLFQRYASESLTRNFNYDEFKSLFLGQFFPQYLQLLFQQIEQWGTKQLWLSDASIYYILNFIEQTIIQKNTWNFIKTHYNTVLEHVIFPLLTPNEATLDSFENDPQEYVHRNMELWNDSYSPDLAAASLLTTSVSKRGKTTLQPTLEFVISTLQSNVGDFANIPLESALRIESSFRIFSCIVDRLTLENSPYVNEIEGFLVAYVFPFFNSKFGFLRTRVCEICSKVGMLDFQDSTVLQIIYTGIIHCLNDGSGCLPVQLLAALALQAFIHNEQFQNALSEVVIPTMQKLLQLSDEFESDTISGVMQDFVEQFATQLHPFGVELMKTLVQQFLKLGIELHDASNIQPDELLEIDDLPDESDKQMAALGILSTTISILLSFENSKEVLRNLEQSFYPAAEFILKNSVEDFYRECCEFIENSTFLLREISPISWKELELIGEANGKEESMVSFYLEDFMLVINNCTIYGKNELKQNEFYSKILFEIYRKAAISEDSSLSELAVVFDLSQKLILCLEGSLPASYRETFLQDAAKAIQVERPGLKKNIVFGVTTFNVIASSIISAPLITLQFLRHHNTLELFLDVWLTFYVPQVRRVYDIKLYTLALLSMLCQLTPQAIVDLSLETIWQKLGPIMIELISRYPAALKELQEKKTEFSPEEYPMESFNGWDDNEEDLDPDSGENVLENHLKSFANDNDSIKFVSGDPFNDVEDFEDLEEDPLSGSILDELNIYDVLKISLATLRNDDSNRYAAFIQSMSLENKNTLNHLMNL